jgi:hypothetical protein
VSLDRTRPQVSVATPAQGGRYIVGSAVSTSFRCSDALSGIQSCSGPTTLDTASVGERTATFTGTDRAGNTTSLTVTYGVTWAFEGFLAPVDNAPTVNSGKAGKTYPVKWRLRTAGGQYLTELSAIESIRYESVSCSTWLGDPLAALETASTGATSLRNSAGTYVYDWRTPSRPGCYVLRVTVADGLQTTYTANFNLALN